jgi:hypothetical protein
MRCSLPTRIKFEITEVYLLNNADEAEDGKDIISVVGTRPSINDLEWIKLGQNIFENSPGLADDIAKNFVTLNTSLITIYTGILAFLKISEEIFTFFPAWISWIMISVPIILWLLSIYKNVDVYSPRIVEFDLESPQSIKEEMNFIVKEKSKALKWGKIFFLFGLFMAALIIIAGCSLTQTKSVQFIISEGELPVFENMSIEINTKTMTTASLTFIDEEDTYYKVRLNNGKFVRFNKDLVDGIIYTD